MRQVTDNCTLRVVLSQLAAFPRHDGVFSTTFWCVELTLIAPKWKAQARISPRDARLARLQAACEPLGIARDSEGGPVGVVIKAGTREILNIGGDPDSDEESEVDEVTQEGSSVQDEDSIGSTDDDEQGNRAGSLGSEGPGLSDQDESDARFRDDSRSAQDGPQSDSKKALTAGGRGKESEI